MNKPDINQIFNDLDEYREFCVEFGRVFDERDLYSKRSYNYRDFLSYKEEGRARNHWYGRPRPKKDFNKDGKKDFKGKSTYKHKAR